MYGKLSSMTENSFQVRRAANKSEEKKSIGNSIDRSSIRHSSIRPIKNRRNINAYLKKLYMISLYMLTIRNRLRHHQTLL